MGFRRSFGFGLFSFVVLVGCGPLMDAVAQVEDEEIEVDVYGPGCLEGEGE